MNISTHDKKILFVCFRRLLLLTLAFLLGSLAGKAELSLGIHPVSGPVLSTSENWGLSFPEEGTLPTANASIEELKQYDAYYAQDTDEKILYLTFDCGYENGATPAILDALKKHQAPAAFFVVGNFVRDNPDLIRRMTEEGHTVANHTLSHPDMSKISSVENFQKELSGVESLYKEITGTDMIKYYRPPQGIYSTENLKMAKQLGYQTFFWSLAYVDWQQDNQPTHEEAFDKLLSRVHPGGAPLKMGGNGIYLPSVVRPYQSSIKSKKDSFPYGCCPFSYALLLFISGFETFYNLNHLLGWIGDHRRLKYFTRWCQLYTLHCRCNS